VENPELIVLTGNAGIRKSWFQLFLLRRLLNEEGKSFSFVVHQFGTEYSLYHFETCQAWSLEGRTSDIKTLLNRTKNSLYFCEPDAENVKPLSTDSRSILFQSSNSVRLKERPHFIDMPDWTWDELVVIANEENIDAAVVKQNYVKFGGIIRYALRNRTRLQ
jgi:hypothetical protein